MSEEVLEQEERRWAALIANDIETLDALVHPALSYTHSNAVVDSKDEWIGSLTSGMVDYQSVEREDVALSVHGPTAVITGKATFKVGLPNGGKTIVARFTAVWVDDGGAWRFFAWQNTPIPGA